MTDSDASPGPLPGKGRARFNARQTAWSIVAIILAITLILSFLTLRNYAEVARAGVLTEVLTEESAAVILNASGDPESVVMTLRFTIENPSGKELKIWILAYKGWVRDIPAEQDIDHSRDSIDGELYVYGTTQLYFPVFVASYSFDNPSILLPPNGNITITRQLFMNRSEYPDIMQGFEAISDHAAGAGAEVEWLHYSTAIILITDIPPYSGLSHAANVIRRYYGVDVTPGTGGAGP